MINTKKMPDGYKDSALGIIPLDWEIKKLGEVCTKITDGTHGTPTKQISGRPFLTAIHVKDGSIDYNGCYYLSEKDHIDIYKRCNPERGDVLMVNIGAGVCSFAMNKVDYEFSMKNVALLKPNKALITGEYLECTLLSNKKKYINSLLNGGAQPFLGLYDISKMKILVPTHKEQEQIAEILSLWDSAIEKQSALVNALTHRKRALMQQLLTARKRLQNFNEPWQTTELKELCDFRNGKAHENDVCEDGQYILVNSKFISTDGTIAKDTNKQRSPLYKDEVVMVMSDVPNGRAIAKCFYIECDNKYTLNQRICSLNSKEHINALFLYYKVNRNRHYLQFDDGVKQTNLRKEDILEYPIFYPILIEQQAIANILATADREIKLAKKRLDSFRTQKRALMQQLLTGKKRIKI